MNAPITDVGMAMMMLIAELNEPRNKKQTNAVSKPAMINSFVRSWVDCSMNFVLSKLTPSFKTLRQRQLQLGHSFLNRLRDGDRVGAALFDDAEPDRGLAAHA